MSAADGSRARLPQWRARRAATPQWLQAAARLAAGAAASAAARTGDRAHRARHACAARRRAKPGVGMLVGRRAASRAPSAAASSNGRRWPRRARLLAGGRCTAVRMQRVVLGADLGQCCGGVVEVWMERYTRADRASAAHGAAKRAGRGAALLTQYASSRTACRAPDRQRSAGTDPESRSAAAGAARAGAAAPDAAQPAQ